MIFVQYVILFYEPQVASLTDKRIKTCYITSDQNDESVKRWCHPWTVLDSVILHLRFFLETRNGGQCCSALFYTACLRVFVIDEAHTVV